MLLDTRLHLVVIARGCGGTREISSHQNPRSKAEPVVPELRRLRQEDCREFEASLVYRLGPY